MNINSVVEQGLCHTCGACYAVCKAECIQFKETLGGNFFPVVDESICTNCGSCLAVCAGICFDEQLMQQIPEDPFVGASLGSFVGRATDKKIYRNSQSGGIVSALLKTALEYKTASAIATVSMSWGNPPKPNPSLARSVNDIILAQKSKYCPVPILSILKCSSQINEKIIFVGTSCQVHGLMNLFAHVPRLREKVVLIIGLVCDRVMTYAAIDYLIDYAKFENQEKKYIEFRDKCIGGYPGDVHIKSGNGEKRIVTKKERMRIKDIFTPARCRICFDKMNVFSDIVVGDPHGIKNIDRNMGESIAITRTSRGKEFFNYALEQNAFVARKIAYQNILKGQRINLKRKGWAQYYSAWLSSGREAPAYCQLINNMMKVRCKRAKREYVEKLKHSISIDEYSSRKELLDFAKRKHRVGQKSLFGIFLTVVISIRKTLKGFNCVC